MNTPSTELFTIPACEPDPLDHARRELVQAEADLARIEADGCDDTGMATRMAEDRVSMAAAAVHAQELRRLHR